MLIKKYKIIKNFSKGFIAALDQSYKSVPKTLELYGIKKKLYINSKKKMCDLINKMRIRILTNKFFISKYIIGVILFEDTIKKTINNLFIPDYLLKKKKILSFLKIDCGLEKIKDGVQAMKKILTLKNKLNTAISYNIFGTKMRSLIHDANKKGIKKIVKQQFYIAKKILKYNLIPIIEPEISIFCLKKKKAEKILKKYLMIELSKIKLKKKIILKLTLPSKKNFYKNLMNLGSILCVVALSGGYSRKKSVNELKKNVGMKASFSRALLEGLKVYQNNKEFDEMLYKSIISIYNASL